MNLQEALKNLEVIVYERAQYKNGNEAKAVFESLELIKKALEEKNETN